MPIKLLFFQFKENSFVKQKGPLPPPTKKKVYDRSHSPEMEVSPQERLCSEGPALPECRHDTETLVYQKELFRVELI